MFSPTHLAGLHSFLAVPASAVTGLAFALFRKSGALANPFGLRGPVSLMNFSSQGTLRCICLTQYGDGARPDRRRFCRGCGCEVVRQDPAMLEKQLSRQDIAQITQSLRRATLRASHLDLPSSITSVDQLDRYLDSSEPKTPRTPPTRPSSVEQPQVH